MAQDAVLQADHCRVHLFQRVNPLEAARAEDKLTAELLILTAASDAGVAKLDDVIQPNAIQRIKEVFDHETLQRAVEVTLLQRTLADRRIAGAFQIIGQRSVAYAQAASDPTQDGFLEVSICAGRMRRVKGLKLYASRQLMERAGFCAVDRRTCAVLAFIVIGHKSITSRRCEKAHLRCRRAGSNQFSLTIAVQHL